MILTWLESVNPFKNLHTCHTLGATVLQPLSSISLIGVQTGGDSILANLLSEIKLGQQQFKIMEMEALLTSYESTTKDWLEGFDLGLEMLVSALDAHKREAATDTMEHALWEEIRADEIFVLTPPGY